MSVLSLWLRQFQHRLPLLCLLHCLLPCQNPFDTVMHHGSQIQTNLASVTSAQDKIVKKFQSVKHTIDNLLEWESKPSNYRTTKEQKQILDGVVISRARYYVLICLSSLNRFTTKFNILETLIPITCCSNCQNVRIKSNLSSVNRCTPINFRTNIRFFCAFFDKLEFMLWFNIFSFSTAGANCSQVRTRRGGH